MAVYKKASRAYSIGTPLAKIAQQPIVSDRAPTVKDRAEVGTSWIDKGLDTGPGIYTMAGVAANISYWMPSYKVPQHVIVTSPTVSVVMNHTKGVVTLTGFTTAANTSFDFTISNTYVSDGDPVMVSAVTNSTNASGIIISRTETTDNGIVLTLWNGYSAAAIDGNIIITYDLMK